MVGLDEWELESEWDETRQATRHDTREKLFAYTVASAAVAVVLLLPPQLLLLLMSLMFIRYTTIFYYLFYHSENTLKFVFFVLFE